MERREIKFHFTSDDNAVSWNEYKRIMNSFQNALYVIGEFDKFGDIRFARRRPAIQLKEYNLWILPPERGSFVSTVQLSIGQVDYTVNPLDAFDKLLNTVNSIASKSDLKQILPDNDLRRKVLRYLSDGFKKLSGGLPFRLGNNEINDDFNDSIDELLSMPYSEDNISIIGQIVDIKTSGTNISFALDSTKGYIQFPLNIEIKDTVIDNIEKIVCVQFSQIYEPSSRKNVIKEVQRLIPINEEHINIDIIENKDTKLFLNEEIIINTSFENPYFIFENDDFNILTYAESYIDALNSFQEDFIFDYDRLSTFDDETLTDHAKRIKEKYLEIVNTKEINNAYENKKDKDIIDE